MSLRLHHVFTYTAISLGLVVSPCAGAQTSVDQTIDALGLVESDTPVSEMKRWRRPESVIVISDGPDRLAWFQEVLPEDIELIPARNEQEAVQAAKENAGIVRAAVGFCSPELVRASPSIHWLQMSFAGIGRCASIPEVAEGDYLLTNMQRLAGPQIAEHVIAMMLYFARGLDHFAEEQRNNSWNRFAVPPGELWSVKDKTMLVAGLGGIGTQSAMLASGLGMRVIATRNSSREGPDYVDYVGLADELPDLLGQADVVVNALPLTDSTRGLFDAALFSRMKNDAIFINVGRGGTVVTADLITALEHGTIAAAGLDVQDPEPVPEDHPLWGTPNVLITPHMSSFNDAGRDSYWTILRENLRRYVNGESMLSVVDIEAGY